jgi:hypothetical protein
VDLIDEHVDQQKAVPVAEFLDGAALGYHTVLLLITTAVSAISPDPVSGLERTFSFRHSLQTSSLILWLSAVAGSTITSFYAAAEPSYHMGWRGSTDDLYRFLPGKPTRIDLARNMVMHRGMDAHGKQERQ